MFIRLLLRFPIALLAAPAFALAAAAHAEAPFDMVYVPGGEFTMGDPAGDADEAPHDAVVGPFLLMRFEVTNRQFAEFVAESGHATDPERRGWGYVWPGSWERREGAEWRHPEGPDDSIAERDDHPVVQVSWADAGAFCAHYGLRLPSEAEWEFAARGTDGRLYPWGDWEAQDAVGRRRANFGTVDCCGADASDGWETTAPVGQFPSGASAFELQDMAGNVWEWTSSFDDPTGRYVIRGGGWGNNPYCLRVSYRHKNPPDIGLDMVGFRCAGDL